MPEKTEICQRCKSEVGECRTLSVSCDFDLSELELPLTLIVINGHPQVHVGEKEEDYGPSGKHSSKVFENSPDWVHRNYRYHTVRICKDCRADWMRAFKFWFENPIPSDDEALLEQGKTYERTFGASQKRDILNEDSFDEPS